MGGARDPPRQYSKGYFGGYSRRTMQKGTTKEGVLRASQNRLQLRIIPGAADGGGGQGGVEEATAAAANQPRG